MNNSAKSYIISVSLPSSLAKEVDTSAKKMGRPKSQLFQEAVRQYLWLLKWKEVQGYGINQASEQGLAADDVERLINEYREEQTSA
jgi:metal-responsive CopG/Arc/MetJ family transcriptional regulator